MLDANNMPANGGLDAPYQAVFGDVSKIIDTARESAARSVNAAMTAAYWLVGRRIVESEQSGEERAEYGAALVERLAEDLTVRFGRGFSIQNIYNMRLFYLSYQPDRILQTPSGEFDASTTTELGFDDLLTAFPLPWSAYVRLLAVRNELAREFYETEALRGGWSVRQLNRQIGSQFYERTALSRSQAAMLTGGQQQRPEDIVRPETEIKDPFVLEFLDLKDEYSESDLEEALIQHLETFLLELGDDFCFLGRQRRLRVGGQWYRVDLLFFHRRLRCLVVIDLKIGGFTHADAGQMHFYLNYAKEHWAREGENPPVGLILCSEKDEALAHYALEGLSNNVTAAEYRITLPDETVLAGELNRTRQAMELRGSATLPTLAESATPSLAELQGTGEETQEIGTAYPGGLMPGHPVSSQNAPLPRGDRLIWDHHHRFQCVGCGSEAVLSGSLEGLVCQNPKCIYADVLYDQHDILHVMLVAPSLQPYHREIRRILDERQVPHLRQPYYFRLIPEEPGN